MFDASSASSMYPTVTLWRVEMDAEAKRTNSAALVTRGRSLDRSASMGGGMACGMEHVRVVEEMKTAGKTKSDAVVSEKTHSGVSERKASPCRVSTASAAALEPSSAGTTEDSTGGSTNEKSDDHAVDAKLRSTDDTETVTLMGASCGGAMQVNCDVEMSEACTVVAPNQQSAAVAAEKCEPVMVIVDPLWTEASEGETVEMVATPEYVKETVDGRKSTLFDEAEMETTDGSDDGVTQEMDVEEMKVAGTAVEPMRQARRDDAKKVPGVDAVTVIVVPPNSLTMAGCTEVTSPGVK